MADEFLKPATVTKLIEAIVRDKKVNYIEAVILFCKERDVEYDEIVKLLSPSVKRMIRRNAESLNFLPQSDGLPYQSKKT